jgi:hypothetical protein
VQGQRAPGFGRSPVAKLANRCHVQNLPLAVHGRQAANRGVCLRP